MRWLTTALLLFLTTSLASCSDVGFVRLLDGLGDFELGFPRCKEDVQAMLNGLLNGEKWALKMADSSTKIPVGILTGNLVDFGNFDECLGIRSDGAPLSPQHCMATLTTESMKMNESFPGMPLDFRWSYCIPDSCPAVVLESVLVSLLADKIPDVNVTVPEKACQTGAAVSLTGTDVLGISIWAIFGCLAIASTIYDVVTTALKKETNPWLVSFSLCANIGRLMSGKVSEGTLSSLNGIRFLSIMWVMLGHRFIYFPLSSVMNFTDIFKEFEKLYFQIFAGGVLAVDTFFLLSGLLNSYLLLKVLDKRKSFPIKTFYIHRYLRSTPTLAAVVVMHATWFHLLGSGPAWPSVVLPWRDPCIKYWWPTLLYINNYYNPTRQCTGQSWYLAADMQMYWLSPLVIWPVWKYPRFGKYYLGVLLMLSAVSQFAVAYVHEFRMSFSLATMTNADAGLSELLYLPTHTRATPYIVGIVLGTFLNNLKRTNKKPLLHKNAVILGWFASTILCLSVIFGNYPLFQSPEKHPYNRLESSFYIGLHRVAWSIGISWVIFACEFGYGGLVHSILSWKFFVPLSRLTFCIFLIHMAVQQYFVGVTRTTGYYQMSNFFHGLFGDVVMSVLAALLLCLLFEYPLSTIERLIFKGREGKPRSLQSYNNKGYEET